MGMMAVRSIQTRALTFTRQTDGALIPAPGLVDVAVPFGALELPEGLTVTSVARDVETVRRFLHLAVADPGSHTSRMWRRRPSVPSGIGPEALGTRTRFFGMDAREAGIRLIMGVL